MRLTQFTDYSLRLAVYLATHPGRACTVREIAEWYGISRDHLVKVAHNLSKKGFILGEKGRRGGLRLARPADQITLGAIVRATEPDFHAVECFNPVGNSCRITRACHLKHVLGTAMHAFMSTLDARSLASIAQPHVPSFHQQKEKTYEYSGEVTL